MPPKHTVWLLGMDVLAALAERCRACCYREAAGASLISAHLLTALEREAGKACGQLPKI